MDDTKSLPESPGGTPQTPPRNIPPDMDLVFYYSREHRLAKASPTVKALNNPASQNRAGLFSIFTATRSHRVLLISIIVLCVFISLISRFTKEKNTLRLGGNTIVASVTQFQEGSYLSIKKNYKQDTPVYTGAVDLVISPITPKGKGRVPEKSPETTPILTHRIFFTLKQEEEYGLALPFDASTFLILLRAEEEHIVFKVKPK